MAEYITKEGMHKLQLRIAHLLEVERPAVVNQVVTAREMGDLSENAEYHAARERQRHIDTELTHLRSRAAKLTVIDSSTMPKDTVRFGAYVMASEEGSDQTHNFRLVGVDEADGGTPELQLISVASPIGKAMIGKKPGEVFIVRAPRGDRHFKVLEIK